MVGLEWMPATWRSVRADTSAGDFRETDLNNQPLKGVLSFRASAGYRLAHDLDFVSAHFHEKLKPYRLGLPASANRRMPGDGTGLENSSLIRYTSIFV